MKIFSRVSPEEKFWIWFQKNAALLANYDKNQEQVIPLIIKNLGHVHPDLRWEMGQNAEGIYEFIISAGGISEMISAVLKLYKAAPVIKGWSFIAFRPRKPIQSIHVEMEKVKLSHEDVYYQSRPHEYKTDIAVYLKGLSEENKNALLGAAFICLDMMIGEYDVMTRIGNIDFEPLPPNPEKENLKPFSRLREEIDSRKEAKTSGQH